jgi:hypothetical protein
MAQQDPNKAGLYRLFAGMGRLFMDQGNRNNEPASPPVQVGSYEWIIPQMFPSQAIVNIPAIPLEFQDWGAYGVNIYYLSGVEGGGSTGDVPQFTNGPVLFYDENTGLYVDISGASSL